MLGAFATPRPGRQVVDVSGGRRAVVYMTSAHRSDVVVSIRYAGEERGAPVTGLPTLLKLAVAQP